MKNINRLFATLMITFLMFNFEVSGQQKAEAKGDKLMYKFHFLAATEAYQQAIEEGNDSDKLKKKLADCYRLLNDPENTVSWYGEIIENIEVIELIDRYYYAQALSSIGQYDEANKWFEIYSSGVPEGETFAVTRHLSELYLDSARINLNPVSFNSEQADFSPTFYQDGLVYVSGRGKSGQFKWNESSFLDLYFSAPDSTECYTDGVVFNKKLNSRYHEGPLAFYNDGKSLVLTRNNFEEGFLQESSNGVTKLKLYFTEIDDKGKWTKVTPFQYNNDEYSIGHPAITEDGKTLYFISDMPGGHGGTDIYVTIKNGDQWSEPKSLGEKVNTEGNEMFPFLYEGKTIYFASNGHNGLGGLDIFRYDPEEANLKNMGYPINSSRDDFGLILDENGKNGFLASNRNTENGVDNIYQFEISEPKPISIKTIVLDADTDEPIENASVSVSDKDNEIAKSNTANDGSAAVTIPKINTYNFEVTKTGYVKAKVDIQPQQLGEDIIIRLEKSCLSAKGLVEIISPNEITGSVAVILTDKVTGQMDTSIVSNLENYEFCVEPQKDYNLKFEKEKFFTQSFDFTANKNDPMAFRKVVLEEIILDKAIKLDNIYYDLAKWDIREDAGKELDKLVKILQDNPTIEIELGSHTDSRGGDIYNLNLSDKRAKSATKYIISQGIDASRIVGRGYGETALNNECANGVKCSKEEHQANRRTEFKVLKY